MSRNPPGSPHRKSSSSILLPLHANLRRLGKLHSLGLRPGDPAAARTRKRPGSLGVGELVVEFLRGDDYAYVNRGFGLEGVFGFYVVEFCVCSGSFCPPCVPVRVHCTILPILLYIQLCCTLVHYLPYTAVPGCTIPCPALPLYRVHYLHDHILTKTDRLLFLSRDGKPHSRGNRLLIRVWREYR